MLLFSVFRLNNGDVQYDIMKKFILLLGIVISLGVLSIIFFGIFSNNNEFQVDDPEHAIEVNQTIFPDSSGILLKSEINDFSNGTALKERFRIVKSEQRDYIDNKNEVRHIITIIEYLDSKGAKDYFDFNPSKFEIIDTNGNPLEYDTKLVENLDAETCKSTKRSEYAGFTIFSIYCNVKNYNFQIFSSTTKNNIQEKLSIDLATEILDKIYST